MKKNRVQKLHTYKNTCKIVINSDIYKKILGPQDTLKNIVISTHIQINRFMTRIPLLWEKDLFNKYFWDQFNFCRENMNFNSTLQLLFSNF